MTAPDIIALAVSIVCIGAATFYIIRQKKKGNHCIGCPNAATCPRCHCGCQREHGAEESASTK